MSHPPARNNRFLQNYSPLLEIILVVLLSSFFCFWKLGSTSIQRGDEALYVLASQGAIFDGDWWLPTFDNKPFLLKPPLKLWLSALAVLTFGQSHLTYRMIDAGCGIGICLLVFLFAKYLFRSRTAGFFAVLSLLGAYDFMLLHGPRHAMLDIPLVFFTTLATFAAWEFFQTIPGATIADSPELRRRNWRAAIVGGSAVGLAVLVKSAAGFFPLVCSGVFLLLSGKTLELLKTRRLSILLIITLSITIPLPYFAWHCAYTYMGCQNLIIWDLVGRIKHGYWNEGSRLFYLDLLLVKGRFMPPLLIAGATLYGIYQAVFRRDHRYLFLLCSIIVPLTLLSVATTRSVFYIHLIMPILAVLLGAAISMLVPQREDFRVVKPMTAIRTALVLVSLVLVLHNLAAVVGAIARSSDRIGFDRAVTGVLAYIKHSDQPVKIITHQVGELALRELAYKKMLSDNLKNIRRRDAFLNALEKKDPHFVMTSEFLASSVARARSIKGYQFLQRGGFPGRVALLSYVESAHLHGFTPSDEAHFFSTMGSDRLAFGWNTSENTPAEHREAIGHKSGIILQGNLLMRELGTSASLLLDLRGADQLVVRINDQEIVQLPGSGEGFHYYDFDIPPTTFLSGPNLMTLTSQKTSTLATPAEFLLARSLRLTLNQN